jgi:hypothetical protein
LIHDMCEGSPPSNRTGSSTSCDMMNAGKNSESNHGATALNGE